jgi:hypothetical protein
MLASGERATHCDSMCPPDLGSADSLISTDVQEILSNAVKSIPHDVWEAIALAEQLTVTEKARFYVSAVGACDAVPGRDSCTIQ